MATVVRPADLKSDRAAIVDAVLRFINPAADAERYDWLYTRNPHGRARVWVATDTGSDTIVGVASAFPRKVSVSGREQTAWVLGDFCVDPAHRALGPALQLQRAALTELATDGATLLYDFPSQGMLAVYARLRIETSTRMVRFAKPLRVDRQVREVVKGEWLARVTSRPLNVLLAASDAWRGSRSSLTVAAHENECGKEFSVLWEQNIPADRVCIERSADYLNWRYLSHPLRRHRVVAARHEGVLRAYAVVAMDSAHPAIVDVFGSDEPDVMAILIRRTVAMLRERGASTVSVPLVDTHPLVATVKRLGFRSREAIPVVLYEPRRRDGEPAAAGRLFLMAGDRDS